MSLLLPLSDPSYQSTLRRGAVVVQLIALV